MWYRSLYEDTRVAYRWFPWRLSLENNKASAVEYSVVLRFRIIAYAFTLSHDNLFYSSGYSGFQVTGMVEGFFGFEILDSGMMSLCIMNVFDETENVLGCLESWKFNMGYFLRGRGVLFSPGTFSVLLETLGTLLAFDFYPNSIIPVKSGVPPCAY